jgi:hypothetical protein
MTQIKFSGKKNRKAKKYQQLIFQNKNKITKPLTYNNFCEKGKTINRRKFNKLSEIMNLIEINEQFTN